MCRLERLRVRHFRNIEGANLGFSGRIVVFHGENAQGKTNILEAAYLLSNLQSFRARRSDDLVMTGQSEAGLRAEIREDGGLITLGLTIDPEGKKARIDQRTPSSAAEYLGVFRSVFFGPQDMELSGGNFSMRRRYLDRAAFSENPQHLDRLKNYARVLRQRNEALRKNIADLDAWSLQLARLSMEITGARLSALEGLKNSIGSIHGSISGGREELTLRLKGAEKLLSKGVEGLLAEFHEDEEEDRKRGFTRHGPHRERMEMALAGREISTHGSQGQRRTAALSLKLALLSWIEERSGSRPVFLLDDPGSELDGNRLGFLGDFISDWGGQTFISSVGAEDVPIRDRGEEEFFTVAGGTFSKG